MKKKILAIVEENILLKTGKFNPKDFYKNRDGLYIFSNFTERIVEKSKPIKSDAEYSIASFKLLTHATDEQIENALPKEHLFNESDLCAIIADLITKQAKGEKGTLILNGYANLFYTGAFVVYVGWCGGGWDVDAWHRDGNGWNDVIRVFSPATGS